MFGIKGWRLVTSLADPKAISICGWGKKHNLERINFVHNLFQLFDQIQPFKFLTDFPQMFLNSIHDIWYQSILLNDIVEQIWMFGHFQNVGIQQNCLYGRLEAVINVLMKYANYKLKLWDSTINLCITELCPRISVN